MYQGSYVYKKISQQTIFLNFVLCDGCLIAIKCLILLFSRLNKLANLLLELSFAENLMSRVTSQE